MGEVRGTLNVGFLLRACRVSGVGRRFVAVLLVKLMLDIVSCWGAGRLEAEVLLFGRFRPSGELVR